MQKAWEIMWLSKLISKISLFSIEENILTSISWISNKFSYFHCLGNQLDCDCQIKYLFTWLQMWQKNLNSKKLSSSPSNASSNLSEKSSVLSAVCATPPKLTNARVYELSMNLDCDTWTRDSSTSSSDIQVQWWKRDYFNFGLNRE